MSHRGSLLCLPSGLWAWPVTRAEEINALSLTRVFADGDSIGHFLLGAGRESWAMSAELMLEFRRRRITLEVMRTGTAVSTYNILLGEGRRVAAGLIATE